jgi:hypothetical protein
MTYAAKLVRAAQQGGQDLDVHYMKAPRDTDGRSRSRLQETSEVNDNDGKEDWVSVQIE